MTLFLAAGCKRDGDALLLPDGKPLRVRIPRRFQTGLERAYAAFRQESEAARHRRAACASSIRRSTSSASTISISTSSPSASSWPGRRARSCAPISAPRPRKMPGSRNLAGIADPVVDALIDKAHRGEVARRTRHHLPRARPRAARRALLGAALVQARRTGSRIGTFSAARTSRRTSIPASPRPGGGMTRKPNASTSSAADEA